jgi:hypothetical protein
MSLKDATVIAIVGTWLVIVLGVLQILSQFITPIQDVLFVGRGVVLSILYLLLHISYLVFFMTLSSKQK